MSAVGGKNKYANISEKQPNIVAQASLFSSRDRCRRMAVSLQLTWATPPPRTNKTPKETHTFLLGFDPGTCWFSSLTSLGLHQPHPKLCWTQHPTQNSIILRLLLLR